MWYVYAATSRVKLADELRSLHFPALMHSNIFALMAIDGFRNRATAARGQTQPTNKHQHHPHPHPETGQYAHPVNVSSQLDGCSTRERRVVIVDSSKVVLTSQLKLLPREVACHLESEPAFYGPEAD